MHHITTPPTNLSHMQVAGPIWLDPIHDPEFATSVRDHISDRKKEYAASDRLVGMLTAASEVRCTRTAAAHVLFVVTRDTRQLQFVDEWVFLTQKLTFCSVFYLEAVHYGAHLQLFSYG